MVTAIPSISYAWTCVSGTIAGGRPTCNAGTAEPSPASSTEPAWRAGSSPARCPCTYALERRLGRGSPRQRGRQRQRRAPHGAPRRVHGHAARARGALAGAPRPERPAGASGCRAPGAQHGWRERGPGARGRYAGGRASVPLRDLAGGMARTLRPPWPLGRQQGRRSGGPARGRQRARTCGTHPPASPGGRARARATPRSACAPPRRPGRPPACARDAVLPAASPHARGARSACKPLRSSRTWRLAAR